MLDSPFIWTAIGLAVGIGTGMVVQTLRSPRAEPAESDSDDRRRRTEEQIAFMGTVATGLAHELRNPLGAIRMNLQLLKEEWENPITEREQRGTRKLDVLLHETERLQQILDEFLRFASGKEVRREKVNLNDLIEDLAGFVAPQIEKTGIRIMKDLADDLPPIQADPGLLRQALMNLMLNAGQAMPDGGTITLKTEHTDSSVRVHIRDTGRGIPKNIRHRVFELYFSTRPAGTGLGLPITKRIVEEHAGKIQIMSEPGKGTCVTLIFPHE